MWQQAEAILAGWREWMPVLTAPPQLLDELPGGRTNHSYLIRIAGEQAVLRVNAADSTSLGIDRRREQVLHRQAAVADLAPRLIFCDPGCRFLITAHIDGRQWTRQDLASASSRQRVRDLISEVQTLPVVFPRFNYTAYVERYWALLSERRPQVLSSALREQRRMVMSDVSALQEVPWEPVVAHHDLNPENLIEHAGRLYLLDWEYAACGHPDIDRLLVDAETVDPRLRVLSDWMNRLWELLHHEVDSAS